MLRSPIKSRTRLVLILSSLVFTAGGATAGLKAVEPIGVGDEVRYHFTAYHRDGRVAVTTDPLVAEEAIASGAAGPAVETYLSAKSYRIRSGIVYLGGASPGAFEVSAFFLGRKAGDVVSTPFVVEAYGTAQEYLIPRQLGPFRTNVSLDLVQLYSDGNRSRVESVLGPAENLTVGNKVAYGDLFGTVIHRLGDVVELRFETEEGERVRSNVFGWNITLHPDAEGQVSLRPDLHIGEVFITRGCKLPLEDLPPGRYRVVSINESAYVVRQAPERLEHLLGEDLRFEFHILEVDKYASWKRTGGRWWDGLAGTITGAIL
jgi:hypothetical protein